MTSHGYDEDVELLTDRGFVHSRDFDRLLYKVATPTPKGLEYRDVFAYAIGSYRGDLVAVMTCFGRIFVTNSTELLTASGVVKGEDLDKQQSRLVSAVPLESDTSFLEEVSRYEVRESSRRIHLLAPSRYTANTLQWRGALCGHASTCSGRSLIVRKGRRYLRVKKVSPYSRPKDMWSVWADGDPAPCILRKHSVVFMGMV